MDIFGSGDYSNPSGTWSICLTSNVVQGEIDYPCSCYSVCSVVPGHSGQCVKGLGLVYPISSHRPHPLLGQGVRTDITHWVKAQILSSASANTTSWEDSVTILPCPLH